MSASLKGPVTADEWQLRVDLAACYRLVAACGRSALHCTHISVRIPGPAHHFLIKFDRLMVDEITASSLLRTLERIDPACTD